MRSGLFALSIVLSLGALMIGAATLRAEDPHQGFCDGGECCSDHPLPREFFDCYTSSYMCVMGSHSCVEDCTYTCWAT